MNLAFFVPGRPVPQGSMRRSKHGHIIHSNKALKSWRAAVREAAEVACMAQRWRVVDAPIALQLTFLLKAPQRPLHPELAATKPDLDKLVRGIGDALEGVVYTQDSRVVQTLSSKRYAHREGVSVAVEVQG